MSQSFDILLVDDEPVVVDSIARGVEFLNLTCDAAVNAKTARQSLRTNSYQLILVDLMLPDGSGLEILEEAQAHDASVPVILMTGYSTRTNALAALQKGAFDFLPKPFDVPELHGVIGRALYFRQKGSKTEAVSKWKAKRSETGGQDSLHFLGTHVWVSLIGERKINIGAAESFAEGLQEISAVEFPRIGSLLCPGDVCARFLGRKRAHTLWMPLSGRLTEVNAALSTDPGLIIQAPFGRGWVIAIEPLGNVKQELVGLEVR